MAEHKLVDGVKVVLTDAEIAQRQAVEQASAEVKTACLEYRQDLRDITEGVNTEAKVKAVTFPDKP